MTPNELDKKKCINTGGYYPLRKPQQLSKVFTSGLLSKETILKEVCHKRQQDACSTCAIVEKAYSKQLRLDTSCME